MKSILKKINILLLILVLVSLIIFFSYGQRSDSVSNISSNVKILKTLKWREGEPSQLLSVETIQRPSVAVNGKNVYISYHSEFYYIDKLGINKTFVPRSHSLNFAKSIDGGASWIFEIVDPPVFSNYGNPGWNNVGNFNSISTSGKNVYVAYHDFTSHSLKFAKSTDEGATWNDKDIKTIEQGNNGAVGWFTSIAVNGKNVYISYINQRNGDLKFAKSTDEGETWNIKSIVGIGKGIGIGFTSIAISGKDVYITYHLNYNLNDTNGALMFTKSTDEGETWSVKELDYTKGIRVGGDTSIAVSGKNVYISYHNFTNGDLKFAKSIDGGESWSIKTLDSDGRSAGEYTSIAVNGKNIYISYYSLINNDLNSLMFAKSTDGGETWNKKMLYYYAVKLQRYYYNSTSIAVSGKDVYIVYNDSNGDLKFTKSIDGGESW